MAKAKQREKDQQHQNLRAEIAKKAHELYEKSGRVEGRDLENWLEAERLVKRRLRLKN